MTPLFRLWSRRCRVSGQVGHATAWAGKSRRVRDDDQTAVALTQARGALRCRRRLHVRSARSFWGRHRGRARAPEQAVAPLVGFLFCEPAQYLTQPPGGSAARTLSTVQRSCYETDFCSFVYSNCVVEYIDDDIAINAGYGPRKRSPIARRRRYVIRRCAR